MFSHDSNVEIDFRERNGKPEIEFVFLKGRAGNCRQGEWRSQSAAQDSEEGMGTERAWRMMKFRVDGMLLCELLSFFPRILERERTESGGKVHCDFGTSLVDLVSSRQSKVRSN